MDSSNVKREPLSHAFTSRKNIVSMLICKALKVGSKQDLMSQCVSLELMTIFFRRFFVKNHLFHKNEFSNEFCYNFFIYHIYYGPNMSHVLC